MGMIPAGGRRKPRFVHKTPLEKSEIQKNLIPPKKELFCEWMAGEGIRFTNFCSGRSVCTPSRAALLTGSYSRSPVSGEVTWGQRWNLALRSTLLPCSGCAPRSPRRIVLSAKRFFPDPSNPSATGIGKSGTFKIPGRHDHANVTQIYTGSSGPCGHPSLPGSGVELDQ